MTMEQSLPLLPAKPEIPDDAELAGADERAWRELLGRLSRQSVAKHFEAYEDVPWDDPDYAVHPEDPRFELIELDPLGGTDWYRSQPQPVRARIGLHRFAQFMKVGVQFENVLKRGLLTFAESLPNESPEFRYVYHEIAEETQHSMMFQEFVDRTGLSVRGMPPSLLFFARRIPALARRFPELFFVFVLAGEEPIDQMQRRALREKQWRHPLAQRISQIHVIEEARHMSFARAYLLRHVPRLGWLRRNLLALRSPLILGNMATLMLEPSPGLVRKYQIPKDVIASAYRNSPVYAGLRRDSLAKTRRSCHELGLLNPPYSWIWQAFRIAES
ncbi:MAG TPA: diiron oxygenase [Myxococcota bacterium]|nr:diiron oxygenase [Myxococcota bacterium]